jgi:hypothetical protein
VSQLISLIHKTSHILVIREHNHSFAFLPPLGSLLLHIVENQTTNLIIFTEKTAAGTAAIEKEAAKKAILSMIIQPLCSLICSSSLSLTYF